MSDHSPHCNDLEQPAVGAQVHRPVRPLVERLRNVADELHKLDATMIDAPSGQSLYREAADEIERLRDLLDSRPAMNAGTLEAYAAWTSEVYASDMGRKPASPGH